VFKKLKNLRDKVVQNPRRALLITLVSLSVLYTLTSIFLTILIGIDTIGWPLGIVMITGSYVCYSTILKLYRDNTKLNTQLIIVGKLAQLAVEDMFMKAKEESDHETELTFNEFKPKDDIKPS
jgi:hypothetical protein